MVEYPNRPCPVCKGPMTSRQKSACSGKCRAEASRRRKAQAQEDRARRLQALIEEALRLLLESGQQPP